MIHQRTIRAGGAGRMALTSGAALILFGLFGASCPAVLPLPPTPQPGITDVLMRNFAFVPAIVQIPVGESVRWTNLDVFSNHTVTSGNPNDADAGSIFDSGLLGANQSFTFQFNEPGQFRYFCRVHPTLMVNALVIVSP